MKQKSNASEMKQLEKETIVNVGILSISRMKNF